MGEKAAVEPTWRQPDARKGKEAKGKAGEHETEPFGGKTQTKPENHTAKVHERREKVRDDSILKTGVGNEVERTGRKEGGNKA